MSSRAPRGFRWAPRALLKSFSNSIPKALDTHSKSNKLWKGVMIEIHLNKNLVENVGGIIEARGRGKEKKRKEKKRKEKKRKEKKRKEKKRKEKKRKEKKRKEKKRKEKKRKEKKRKEKKRKEKKRKEKKRKEKKDTTENSKRKEKKLPFLELVCTVVGSGDRIMNKMDLLLSGQTVTV
ncbi:hypothetical protein TREES_T100002876 [Tupaia chinensis]|uniref:Uncharacterized protein n=1 Tax=Tupaia chinensis TaxID=246437 RepID=L9KUR6_TUPCH|nr:hypothetical protein TREES_T100002876 [Tupaia chinensis]